MATRHSTVVRGLEAAGTNVDRNFRFRFGRMFPRLPGATFGAKGKEEFDNLSKLAEKMVSGFDQPKDAPDDEESGIPALYTYLGQFIDHDLTFGPEASFQKQKDPDATEDFRTPAFDLDNVYGRGPNDQPYMYAADGKSLLLGDPLTLGNKDARDLQRNSAGRALIGDPRNDENAIVSQLQGLFIRFHNRVVQENANLAFEDVQKIVRDHYQYVVINDFLPRIVSKSVLDGLRTGDLYNKGKLKFFTQFDNPFMPVEFATAAYRLGHSMVRPGYRLNDATLLPIFPIPTAVAPGFPEGLTGFRRMTQDWGIDWGRFIDIDVRAYGTQTLDTDPAKKKAQEAENFNRLQFAYRIDTALIDPLGSLPMSVAGNEPLSLALRNLLRGSQFGLPSGQAIAQKMGVEVLSDDQILIGQGVDNPDKPLRSIVDLAGAAFTRNCPLWTYVLAEAMHNLQTPRPNIPVKGTIAVSTPQLGPVGGRIVAEVFLGLMFADKMSYFNTHPTWKPMLGSNYMLKDFVKFALGQ